MDMDFTTTSSYGVIVPSSRHLFIVNEQPGHYIDEIIVLNPSPTQLATIEHDQHIGGLLFDGGPSYTTLRMEFTKNRGLVASVRFLDHGVMDYELAMMIATFIVEYECLRAGVLCKEDIDAMLPVKILGKSKVEEEEEEESEICVICQGEYKEGQMIGTLECGHEYHAKCVKKWLLRKNECPVCRSIALSL